MYARNATIYTLAAAALAASATTVMAAPDDLYSAEELMDADVYLADSKEQIGEVEDVIFNSDLAVQSFVIETNEVLGLGGESYVVAVDELRVATIADGEDDDQEYRVTLDATLEDMAAYPEYSESWWNDVRAQAGDVWQQTKETAKGAWSEIKETTDDLVDGDDGPADPAADPNG